jgi:hypothetical protein
MNQKKYFFICFISFALLANKEIKAQVNSGWQPIYLLVTGENKKDGIEAFFKLDVCNEEDVIYVKFINHTAKPLKLEWYDAMFTQELKWINEEKIANKKTIQIPANTELMGECSNNLYPQLSVSVKKYISDKKNFKRYSASQLKVIATQ